MLCELPPSAAAAESARLMPNLPISSGSWYQLVLSSRPPNLSRCCWRSFKIVGLCHWTVGDAVHPRANATPWPCPMSGMKPRPRPNEADGRSSCWAGGCEVASKAARSRPFHQPDGGHLSVVSGRRQLSAKICPPSSPTRTQLTARKDDPLVSLGFIAVASSCGDAGPVRQAKRQRGFSCSAEAPNRVSPLFGDVVVMVTLSLLLPLT